LFNLVVLLSNFEINASERLVEHVSSLFCLRVVISESSDP